MKLNIQILTIIILSFTFASCEKVINVKVKNSSPTIVITGDINDQPGPYKISITQSVNLDANNTFPFIDNALVVVSDNVGNVDTFKSIGNGIYNSNTIVGMVGRTYTLNVQIGSANYMATSTMPSPVPFDSLSIVEESGFGKPSEYPEVSYQDPAGIANYYRFVAHKNGDLVKADFVRSDRFFDGKYNQAILRADSSKIENGDTVMVEMQSIDEASYNYFNTLKNVDGNTQTAAPSDPITNLSNSALGYFSAHTSQTKTIVYKQ